MGKLWWRVPFGGCWWCCKVHRSCVGVAQRLSSGCPCPCVKSEFTKLSLWTSVVLSCSDEVKRRWDGRTGVEVICLFYRSVWDGGGWNLYCGVIESCYVYFEVYCNTSERFIWFNAPLKTFWIIYYNFNTIIIPPLKPHNNTLQQ